MVGYESWACMSVELAGPYGSGGALFEWRLDSQDFMPRYESVCEWIDRLTALLTAGSYERREHAGDARLQIQDEETGMPLTSVGRALRPIHCWRESRRCRAVRRGGLRTGSTSRLPVDRSLPGVPFKAHAQRG